MGPRGGGHDFFQGAREEEVQSEGVPLTASSRSVYDSPAQVLSDIAAECFAYPTISGAFRISSPLRQPSLN